MTDLGLGGAGVPCRGLGRAGVADCGWGGADVAGLGFGGADVGGPDLGGAVVTVSGSLRRVVRAGWATRACGMAARTV
ncbi:hypothetical protein Ade02nite_07600 [Paractinoplanes deccanensis]|uniref:Uncharacterized protein n=1 Tax=Paractinoplanes deccanensis TaxID=113561 RepID=A0ABQ3XWM2_9ACTN|nr:hypothetical protein Ade02nite_07600 [Actinoplanes deccanensis]